MGKDAHPTTPTTQHGAAGDAGDAGMGSELQSSVLKRKMAGSGKHGEKKSFKSRTQIPMPLPSNGPRLTCPLTHEALLLKNFNLREAGEGYPGTALRKGMLAAQHRLEDMGLREPDPNRVKVVVHEINTRPLAGDAQKVYEMAKIRNRGHGNILDHSTISGEAGVLG